MLNIAVRTGAAAAAFAFGIAAVWLAGLTAPLEAAVADWLVPAYEISVPAAPLLDPEEADTQEVYAAVLREMFGGDDTSRLLVIRSETSGLLDCTNARLRRFEGVAAETLADYARKDESPRRLSRVPGVGAGQFFLDVEQYEMLFADRYGNGWEDFNSRFPNSLGYTTLSAVGFNRGRDEAFLYAGRGCGPLCGDGWHVLLKKGAHGWFIERSRLLWAS